MKRLLLGLILIFFIAATEAQLTFSPEVIDIAGNPSEEVITTKIDLSNASEEDVVFFWRVQKENTFPSEWNTQFCDFELCYGDNVDESNPNLPNTLRAGETRDVKVYVFPNGTSGESGLGITFYKNKELTDEILHITTNSLVISQSTSVNDIDTDDLIIYPNPTDDYFQISNDKQVKTIVMYTIVGKEIEKFDHNPGQSHNLQALSKGLYLVRLFDKNEKVLKSMRLSKR